MRSLVFGGACALVVSACGGSGDVSIDGGLDSGAPDAAPTTDGAITDAANDAPTATDAAESSPYAADQDGRRITPATATDRIRDSAIQPAPRDPGPTLKAGENTSQRTLSSWPKFPDHRTMRTLQSARMNPDKD